MPVLDDSPLILRNRRLSEFTPLRADGSPLTYSWGDLRQMIPDEPARRTFDSPPFQTPAGAVRDAIDGKPR